MSKYKSPSTVQLASAFLAGVTLVAAMLLIGMSIQQRVESGGNPSFITLLFSGIFIGASTGHFVGLAIRARSDRLLFFSTGIFLSLFVSLMVVLRLSKLGLVVPTMAGAILLMHSSGITDDYEPIKDLVNSFSTIISPVGLSLIGLLKYGIPALGLILDAIF